MKSNEIALMTLDRLTIPQAAKVVDTTANEIKKLIENGEFQTEKNNSGIIYVTTDSVAKYLNFEG